ncbi:MAG: hypothetical protein J7L61_00050, partial [Thermoplasmata archaeon]|nr:hypothetical protein [Thermoplasmata archaeon]
TWKPRGDLYPRPITVTFHPGWNIIAAPDHPDTTTRAGDILAQINQQNGPNTALWLVNWTGTDWQGCYKGTGENFTLDDLHHRPWGNGRAWYLLATRNGTWTP